MAAPHISEHTKHVGDAVSIATVAGTLMEWLPALAALLTIFWTLIRIYETDTVQKLLGKKKPSTDAIQGP